MMCRRALAVVCLLKLKACNKCCCCGFIVSHHHGLLDTSKTTNSNTNTLISRQRQRQQQRQRRGHNRIRQTHASNSSSSSKRSLLFSTNKASSQPEPEQDGPQTENKQLATTNNRGGGTARFTGIQPTSSSSSSTSSSTITESANINILDYILGIILSDIGSIIIGSLGLIVCLVNRLTWAADDDTTFAQVIGQQSRSDLLAVFSSIAFLLNGVSKLDVTSALAETVQLEGILLDSSNGNGGVPQWTQAGTLWLLGHGDDNADDDDDDDGGLVDPTKTTARHAKQQVQWALDSVLSSTPAKSAVIVVYNYYDNTDVNNNNNNNGSATYSSLWAPGVLAGVVPVQESLRTQIPKNVRTPILDRFLTQVSSSSSSSSSSSVRKESYLPTLQALPGKVEFTYLPSNTQAVLIVPITLTVDRSEEDHYPAVLVLGSDTAKSFTPRDVAWCQVLASRLHDSFRVFYA